MLEELTPFTVDVTVSVVEEAVTLVDSVTVVIDIDVTVTLIGDVKITVEATPGISKFGEALVSRNDVGRANESVIEGIRVVEATYVLGEKTAELKLAGFERDACVGGR